MINPLQLTGIEKKKWDILERIYDTLYDAADKILNKYNPCEHSFCDKKHTCLGKLIPQLGEGMHGHNRTEQACCIGCEFWRSNGCNADKPMYCKVWLCGVAINRHQDILKKLAKIKSLASRFRFADEACCREEKSFILSRAWNEMNNWKNLSTWNLYNFGSAEKEIKKELLDIS